jgi:DNA mismatch repair protein MutL
MPSLPIQALPTTAIDRIAAGETIDSPAAAVRELVDNAIDAGATRIQIALWLDRWRIRVTDNGCGLDHPNLERAAQPHSTSKIRDRTDLDQITTLGFRGEALRSLAQLSRLELCSRPQDPAAGEGWRAVYAADGTVQTLEPIALAPGTVAIADDLFYPWAARRAGMPSVPQQYRAIQQAIAAAALCHPAIAWQVQRDDRPWFSLSPGDSAQQILPQLLRPLRFGDLQQVRREVTIMPELARADPVNGTAPGEQTQAIAATLEGVVGLPDRAHRRRPDWVRVAINGRMVQVPELERAIIGAFGQTLPRDRHPIAILHLHLPPTEVDWNRTPAKTEIYLKHSDLWQDQLRATIAEAIALPRHTDPVAPGFTTDLDPEISATIAPDPTRARQLLRQAIAADRPGAYGTRPLSDPGSSHPDSIAPDPTAPDPTAPNPSVLDPSVLDPTAPDRATHPDHPQAANHNPARSLTTTDHRPLPLGLRAIAQAGQTYIVAEHPGGLWLVEQHIAHERVLYEQLRDRWQVVPLPTPITITDLSDREQAALAQLGIEVDPFGEGIWAVRSLPKPLIACPEPVAAVRELAACGDLRAAQVAIACRSAIRNGQPLSRPALQTLLDRWQRTRNPRTCPHGRPIYLALDESSLGRFFRRRWVIGKSHGLGEFQVNPPTNQAPAPTLIFWDA